MIEISLLAHYMKMTDGWPQVIHTESVPIPPHFRPKLAVNPHNLQHAIASEKRFLDQLIQTSSEISQKEFDKLHRQIEVYKMDHKLAVYKIDQLNLKKQDQEVYLIEIEQLKIQNMALKKQLEEYADLKTKEYALKKNFKLLIENTKKNNQFQSKLKAKLKRTLREKIHLETQYSKLKGLYIETKNQLKEIEEQMQYLKSGRSQLESPSPLVGEFFEISNDIGWYYKKHSNEYGPYNFPEINELKDQQTIKSTTLIRKNGEDNWRPFQDTFEFSIPFVAIDDTLNDQKITRYYLRRDSVRVPFYEIVQASLNKENESKVYCTSLSLGGCFLELSRSEIELMNIGQEVPLEFISDSLDHEFKVLAQVMNISHSRPRGIGLMFKELDEETKAVITRYIENAVGKKSLAKKAA